MFLLMALMAAALSVAAAVAALGLLSTKPATCCQLWLKSAAAAACLAVPPVRVAAL